MLERSLSTPNAGGRPDAWRLFRRQTAHELRALSRVPVATFFAVVFPLIFLVLIMALVGNPVIDEREGVRLAQFAVPAFSVFGVVMAAFSALAIGLTEARSKGVLKRYAGTPLPRWAMLGGRTGAALLLSLLSVVVLFAVGVLFYGFQLVWRTMPAAALTLVVGISAFTLLGLAVAALAPSPQAATAMTTGSVVALAFISDLFTIGADLPTWLERLGWVFPLKHFVNAFSDAANPYLTGSGFYPDHLAVMAAWGVLGAVVAIRGLSIEPRSRRGIPAPAAQTFADHAGSARHAGEMAEPRRSGVAAEARTRRARAADLLVAQIRHSNRSLWRDPGSVFFAVAFPVLLVLLVPQLFGRDTTLPDGTPTAQFYAPTMAVYGAAVTAYLNMPEAIAQARQRGVLKRLRGTPLPPSYFLTGRVVSGLWVALVTLVAVLGVGVVLYDVELPGIRMIAVLVTFVLAVVCFAALGVALVGLFRSAQTFTAVGLATLLPLSFVSDIFLIGADFPTWLDAVSWSFPLRHAVHGVADPFAVGATGSGFDVGHLAVILAWTVAGALVAVKRFGWEPRAEQGRAHRG